MSCDALIIGINVYSHLQPLRVASKDTEAIAQLLEIQGEFRVTRVPEIISFSKYVGIITELVA